MPLGFVCNEFPCVVEAEGVVCGCEEETEPFDDPGSKDGALALGVGVLLGELEEVVVTMWQSCTFGICGGALVV